MAAQQLGKAITILMEHERREIAAHEDVDAFHAPSECHAIVSKGEAKRRRLAIRRACHVAGVRNLRLLRRAILKRMPSANRYFYCRFGIVPF